MVADDPDDYTSIVPEDAEQHRDNDRNNSTTVRPREYELAPNDSQTNATTNNDCDNSSTNDDMVVLVVQEDIEITKYSKIDLQNVSEYFAVMLSSNSTFQEVYTNRVVIKQFDVNSITFVLDSLLTPVGSLRYTENDGNQQEGEIGLRPKAKKRSGNIIHIMNQLVEYENDIKYIEQILHLIDYLQIFDSKNYIELVYTAIQIFNNPSIIREQCIVQGYISSETNHVTTIPPNKKKHRPWRFWVCYLFCMDMIPNVMESIEPHDIIVKIQQHNILSNTGIDPISLRRELFEYKLIDREGDGSMYWRPHYTLRMIYERLIMENNNDNVIHYRRKAI